MTQFGGSQLRLVYSLLKPAVRAAARFHVPVRTLVELLRLAYFELLIHQGLTQAQIARRFGQTERHMRSLAQRLRTDFFQAEHEIGLVREVENLIAARAVTESDIYKKLRAFPKAQLDEVIQLLLDEQRIVRNESAHLAIAAKYVLLSSAHFEHRIDALNHFLESVDQAILARLVFDDREEAMMKTISFSASPDNVRAFLRTLEGNLRRDIAELEEDATFAGQGARRYSLALSMAPLSSEGS